jgi:hypothetical protein
MYARKVMVLASVMIVEVAAVAVMNSVVHATLSNAVDLAVHREVLQLHFRLKYALPDAGGHLSHRLCAIGRRRCNPQQQLAANWQSLFYGRVVWEIIRPVYQHLHKSTPSQW